MPGQHFFSFYKITSIFFQETFFLWTELQYTYIYNTIIPSNIFLSLVYIVNELLIKIYCQRIVMIFLKKYICSGRGGVVARQLTTQIINNYWIFFH